MVKIIVTSGKRKTAVAKCYMTEGSGKIRVNGKDPSVLEIFNRLKIEEPLRICEAILGKINFDAKINVFGGGSQSQLEVARLSLSRAIVEFTESKKIEEAFWNYDRNLLVADVRRKEAYKPGDSKARSKRQKSYR